MYDAKTVERFWSKVDRSAGPEACWPWRGGVRRHASKPGVPRFVLSGRGTVYARPMALALSEGATVPERADGTRVVSTCGNMACVNPTHLQRVSDEESGRRHRPREQAKGSRVAGARLDEVQVRLLRRTMQDRRHCVAEMARQMGLHRDTLYSIKWGRTWRHVT